jgi:hypothetical protein
MSEENAHTPNAAARPDDGEMSEAEIDGSLEESFPASDPPSWTLGTDHPGRAAVRRDDPEGPADDTPGDERQ